MLRAEGMLQVLTPLQFPEGTLMCRVGEKAQDAYIVREGTLTRMTLEGRSQTHPFSAA